MRVSKSSILIFLLSSITLSMERQLAENRRKINIGCVPPLSILCLRSRNLISQLPQSLGGPYKNLHELIRNYQKYFVVRPRQHPKDAFRRFIEDEETGLYDDNAELLATEFLRAGAFGYPDAVHEDYPFNTFDPCYQVKNSVMRIALDKGNKPVVSVLLAHCPAYKKECYSLETLHALLRPPNTSVFQNADVNRKRKDPQYLDDLMHRHLHLIETVCLRGAKPTEQSVKLLFRGPLYRIAPTMRVLLNYDAPRECWWTPLWLNQPTKTSPVLFALGNADLELMQVLEEYEVPCDKPNPETESDPDFSRLNAFLKAFLQEDIRTLHHLKETANMDQRNFSHLLARYYQISPLAYVFFRYGRQRYTIFDDHIGHQKPLHLRTIRAFFFGLEHGLIGAEDARTILAEPFADWTERLLLNIAFTKDMPAIEYSLRCFHKQYPVDALIEKCETIDPAMAQALRDTMYVITARDSLKNRRNSGSGSQGSQEHSRKRLRMSSEDAG